MSALLWVRFCRAALFLASGLLLSSAHAQLAITEFMALNTGGLLDEDGDASDWVEIENASGIGVNAEGWFLTDDAANLVKWRFPATTLQAGARLIVFASGKNRAVPGAPLHTSFALNAAGGSLALVQPDGVTIASRFNYGQQFADVSFGAGLGPSRDAEMLLGPSAPLKYLIPAAPVSDAWRGGAAFDDSSWSNGIMAAGFDLNIGPLTVAYSVPANTAGNQAYSGALGLDFDVTQPVQVTELGCFDDTGNGMGLTITVALWRRNNAGTPSSPEDDTGGGIIVSTNFSSAAPGVLLGGQRFKALPAPVALSNGSYTIVAYGYGSGERLANNLGVVSLNSGGGALQFVGRSRYGDNTALFPNVVDVNVAKYGAGTFKFQARPAATFGVNLAPMRNVNASALLRLPFAAPADVSYSALSLGIRFDDGFVAFLNGVEVARRNAPATLAFNSAATSGGGGSGNLDLSAFLHLLQPGSNLLAVHGLNSSVGDNDFLIDTTLSAERGATNAVYFTTPTPGTANAAGLLFPRVVINEIHSDPVDSKSVPGEFLELYNPLPAAVDVSGWAFTRGITWTFAPGTTIPARGYLVLAENPAVVQQRFGATALGPWLGSLANEGETLELIDANAVTVDRVEYGLGFPWPTVGDNDYSMQLIHEGLDNDLGGSWRSAPPTPGARNAVTTGRVPPQIRQVESSPRQPQGGDPLTITARITDPDGVPSVTLEYQIVEPGLYLRLSDPAYTTTWTALPMRDDGAGGDAVAGDDLFTVLMTPDLQRHRRLIRYRIVASDTAANSVRVPYEDDPSPNFAYWVYDGVPAWTGAVQPGVTPAQVFDTNTMRKVRPYHLLSRSNDVWNCQYNPAYNDGVYRFEGTLVVDGQVYDHVRYRVKGQNSTFNTGKNKWRFRFSRGHWLEMPDDYGLTTTLVESLNVSSLPASWAPWNRGMAGLDEVMQYRLSNLAGVPSPRTSYFQLRVVDDPLEQPANTQYDGDFWGLYIAFENQDNRFKDAHGLPDGNTFRMQVTGAGNHLLSQGAGQPADLSDLNAFVSASTGYNRTPTQPEAWWRANVDLQKYFSWRAVNEAVNNTDIRDQENVVYFRDPAGPWHIEPWDCDLLYEQFDRWGPEGTQTTSAYEQIRRCLQVPNLNVEFQNRARELQDLLLNSDQTWKLIDEYVALITDGGPGQPGFVEADRRRWDYNPINPVPPRGVGAFGNYYKTPYPVPDMGRGPYPQPFYRVLASPDFAGLVAWVKNFIPFDPHGGVRLAGLANDPTIPDTPTLVYIGDPEFAADGLTFQCGAFSSPAGRAFAAMRWRLAEVHDPSVPGFRQGTPWRYEIEEVWTSGDLAGFSSTLTLPPAYVREGATYRVRVKFKDAEGRWSHWSDPAQFTAGSGGAARLAQNLIVSELMYNPPAVGAVDGDAFEFIELRNVGPATLNLGGLAFTAGISFTFSNGTTLAPGATFLLVRDAAHFAAKYPGVTVHGVFGGKLDNGGETITLAHPVGGTVLSFTYDDLAPWPAAPDNFDFSLVPVDGTGPFDHDDPRLWRASSSPGGSPGADDPPSTIPPVLISEVLTHTDPPAVDWIELFNPTRASVEIDGWFLTDDPGTPRKFRIPPGTIIGPMGFAVFTEEDFNPTPGVGNSFSLRSAGDDVYLYSGDANTNLTGYSHGFDFGAAANDVTFGRHLISTGEEQFPALLVPTRGEPNSGPRVGPVVINEIHYHPLPGGDEFIELKNISPGPVQLFDPANPANTWQLGGVGWVFPADVRLDAGRTLLLVATDPAIFRARQSVPASVEIFGPWPGVLQDSGERLELRRPDLPDTNGVPYITVDEVRYNDKAPWPFAADGSGASLQRKNGAYSNDPASWEAAAPTPGTEFLGGQAPVILAQPQNRSVLVGQTATFNVGAGGDTPLSYQWAFNGSAIPGATSSNLVLPGVLATQAGGYDVVVFNQAGSVASAVAHLTVSAPLLILAQPTNQAVRPGSNATFRVLAAGSGVLRYQWRKDGRDIPGASATMYSLASAQLTDAGVYTCVITDNNGPVTSAPAELFILVDPIITQNPLSQTLVAGSTVTLSVSVTNTATLPVGYRLRRNNSTLATTFPGAYQVLTQRTAFFTISGTNAAPPWTNYAIIATNLARPNGNLSTSAFLTYATDTDADGLPDNWETTFFGVAGANPDQDSDGDGMLNRQEYVAGTDPTDPSSRLRIEAALADDSVLLSFEAVSNRTYTVQRLDSLVGGAWSKLTDVLARATNSRPELPDLLSGSNRYYRIVTPQQP